MCTFQISLPDFTDSSSTSSLWLCRALLFFLVVLRFVACGAFAFGAGGDLGEGDDFFLPVRPRLGDASRLLVCPAWLRVPTLGIVCDNWMMGAERSDSFDAQKRWTGFVAVRGVAKLGVVVAHFMVVGRWSSSSECAEQSPKTKISHFTSTGWLVKIQRVYNGSEIFCTSVFPLRETQMCDIVAGYY